MASMLQGPRKETGVKKEKNGGRIIAVEEVVFLISFSKFFWNLQCQCT
jgi:hypothetical protein